MQVALESLPPLGQYTIIAIIFPQAITGNDVTPVGERHVKEFVRKHRSKNLQNKWFINAVALIGPSNAKIDSLQDARIA
jgi:hypothetical protein